MTHGRTRRVRNDQVGAESDGEIQINGSEVLNQIALATISGVVGAYITNSLRDES